MVGKMERPTSSRQRLQEVVEDATQFERKETHSLDRFLHGARCLGLRKHPLVKITMFVASLYLFVLAIMLMKDGARSLVPLPSLELSQDEMPLSIEASLK